MKNSGEWKQHIDLQHFAICKEGKEQDSGRKQSSNAKPESGILNNMGP